MIDNLRDVWNIIVQYEGAGFTLILYIASLIWLFVTEKDKRIRFSIIYLPALLLFVYICPVFYRIYVIFLDSVSTYYRVLWLIPMTVTIAYAACTVIYKHRRIGLALMIVLIVVCGRYTYSKKDPASIKKVENLYHIPGYVVELCDYMVKDIDGVDVYACVPLEMLFYVRQYDSTINLIYGREAVEPQWGYYNEYYEAFELDEVIDMEKLLDLTRNNDTGKVCTYFVIDENRELSGEPVDFGLVEVVKVDNYILYKDTVAQEIIREMFKGTVYEQ